MKDNTEKISDLLVDEQKKSLASNKEVTRSFQMMEKEGISFEFTKDPDLLNQYFEIRRQSYKLDKRMDGHLNEGLLDKYDFNSQVLLVTKGKEVIAGARLCISTPENRTLLHIEKDGFSFQKEFPELKLANEGYCTIHRFAVKKEYRTYYGITETLLQRLFLRCIELDIRYIFAIAGADRTRMYKTALNNIGITLIVRKDVRFKSSANTNLFLMVADAAIQPIYKEKKKMVSNPNIRDKMYRVFDSPRIGSILIQNLILTPEERDKILDIQKDYLNQGIEVSFSQIAVDQKFCKQQEIESALQNDVSFRIGKKLVAADIITSKECDIVIDEQKKIKKETGIWIKFAELSEKLGFCYKAQAEEFF